MAMTPRFEIPYKSQAHFDARDMCYYFYYIVFWPTGRFKIVQSTNDDWVRSHRGLIEGGFSTEGRLEINLGCGEAMVAEQEGPDRINFKVIQNPNQQLFAPLEVFIPIDKWQPIDGWTE